MLIIILMILVGCNYPGQGASQGERLQGDQEAGVQGDHQAGVPGCKQKGRHLQTFCL